MTLLPGFTLRLLGEDGQVLTEQPSLNTLATTPGFQRALSSGGRVQAVLEDGHQVALRGQLYALLRQLHRWPPDADVRVFGSVTRGKADAFDLDLLLTPEAGQAQAVRARLLGLMARPWVQSDLDPFLLLSGRLWCRTPGCDGFTLARNARALKTSALKEGRSVLETLEDWHGRPQDVADRPGPALPALR